jgi:purine-binding chemotaxis protein CheW
LPESVIGVADYRGDVVPVIDLRSRFGLPREAATRRTKWILVSLGNQAVALVVDGVSDVFGTAGAELRPAPGIGGDDRRNIMGVTQHDGRLTFVLDVMRLRGVVESLSLPQRAGSSSTPARGSIGPKS